MIRILVVSTLALGLLAAPSVQADEAERLGNIGQLNPGRGDDDGFERRRDRDWDRNERRRDRREERRNRRDDRWDDQRDDRRGRDDNTFEELYGRGQGGTFDDDERRRGERDRWRDRDRGRDDRRDDRQDRLFPDDDRDDRRRDDLRPDGDDIERADPELGHKVIAGLWTGEVEEVGQEPYTIRLSLSDDGSGTAAYSRLNCASEMIPLAGKVFEYREKITMGRDACDDGYVQLRLRKGLLLWSWKDSNGEVRAAATLRRDTKSADGGGATGQTERSDDAPSDEKPKKE